jgi:ammonium transporter, Amt family
VLNAQANESMRFWKVSVARCAGHVTALGAATGVVVGLVAITPACGFVSQMYSILIGVLAAPASYWASRLMKRSGVDDRLECLPCHGLAGFLGIVFTGLFAQKSEDSPVDGAFFGNPMQASSGFV